MRKTVDVDKMTLAGRRFDVQKMADLLDAAYMANGRAPSNRAKVSFAPSGIGYGSGRCARRWFYDFTGGVYRQDDTDPIGIANMAYGTEAHERIQELYERAGILVEAEREINTIDSEEFPPIRGYADLVINWQGEEAVGEIKTTSQESYVSKKVKGQGAGYHLLQVLIYMRVLGLNKGFLLYENKNTQNLLIIPITWNVANTKLIDDTFEWMRNVRSAWEAGKLPTRAGKSSNSVICKQCPFLKHCWSDEQPDGDIKIKSLEVPA